MLNLSIKEQREIVGGTRYYYFTDKTTGYYYVDTNRNRIKSKYYDLKDKGHTLTRLGHYDN